MLKVLLVASVCMLSLALTRFEAQPVPVLNAQPLLAAEFPTTRLPVPPPGPVESTANLIGAFIKYGTDTVRCIQVHEAVWGILHNGRIGYAVLKGIDEKGIPISVSKPELYDRLAFSPEDHVGGTFRRPSDGLEILVEDIEYGIDELGYLEVSLLKNVESGLDKEGHPFARPFVMNYFTREVQYLDTNVTFLIPECCQSVQKTACLPHADCGGGTGDCSGLLNCDCIAAGTCSVQTWRDCDGACGSGCPGNPNDECVGPPTNCGCT